MIIFYTINDESYYTLHPDVKIVVNLDRKVGHNVKRFNCSSFQTLKKLNDKLHFTILDYIPNNTSHPKLLISIQDNNKLDFKVQSLIRALIYGTKRVFKKFRV